MTLPSDLAKTPGTSADIEAATLVTENPNLKWYQGIDKYAWTVLLIAALGWMFDTFDQHLFTLMRQASVTDLLRGTVPDAQLADTAKAVGANLTAVFLIGWAIGGFIFGMIGDRIGRTKTMMITILIYAIFTGLNGFVQTMPQYFACRFMIALGVGGEFAAGAALVAETWPARSRAMGLGLLQSLSAVGNMAAAVVTLVFSFLSWRYVFFIGALPAILILFIRRNVHEPEVWEEAQAKAKASGNEQIGSITALFTDPILRRNTIAGILLATAGVGGLWGVGFFSVDLIGSALKPLVNSAPDIVAITDPVARESAVKAALQHWRSLIFLEQMIGGGCGMFAFALVTERMGRRPAMAIFFVLAFITLQCFFRFVNSPASAFLWVFPLGFCTLAPVSAFAIYFPELFPTRLRSTGIGFCYNAARVLAAAAPFLLGKLALNFANPLDETAGLRVAASIVACIYGLGLLALLIAPETKGQPLPE